MGIFHQLGVSFIACAFIASLSSASEEALKEICDSVVNSRSKIYNECHGTMSISQRGSANPIQVEFWCKGNKLRNDFDEPGSDKPSVCIVDGATYIQRFAGEEAITQGTVTETHPQIRILHPGQIGCCSDYTPFRSFLDGAWIWNGLVPKIQGVAIHASMGSSQETRKFNIDFTQRVPKRLQLDEIEGLTSFEEFLATHPERQSTSVSCSSEIEFLATASPDILRYAMVQQNEGSKDKTVELLENSYTTIEGSTTPLIKSSNWTVSFGNKQIESLHVVIDSIEFGQIDDVVFSIAGLEPANGTVIRDRRMLPDVRAGRYNDGQINYADSFDVTQTTRPNNTVSPNRWRIVLVFVNLLGIFAVLAVIFLSFKKRNRA